MSKEFISKVMEAAVKIQNKHGLPAATIVAQACLETGYGKYVLQKNGKYSYNLFNIKGTGPAGSVTVVAWEVINNQKVNKESNFRAYNNYEESFEDYANLILNGRFVKGGPLIYQRALNVKHDPDKYAHALKDCGYATDPDYAKKLISIMDQYKLREMAVNFSKPPAPIPIIKVGDLVFEGILLEGRTYAPVRALAEALGKQVQWDSTTSTVTIDL